MEVAEFGLRALAASVAATAACGLILFGYGVWPAVREFVRAEMQWRAHEREKVREKREARRQRRRRR